MKSQSFPLHISSSSVRLNIRVLHLQWMYLLKHVYIYFLCFLHLDSFWTWCWTWDFEKEAKSNSCTARFIRSSLSRQVEEKLQLSVQILDLVCKTWYELSFMRTLVYSFTLVSYILFLFKAEISPEVFFVVFHWNVFVVCEIIEQQMVNSLDFLVNVLDKADISAQNSSQFTCFHFIYLFLLATVFTVKRQPDVSIIALYSCWL